MKIHYAFLLAWGLSAPLHAQEDYKKWVNEAPRLTADFYRSDSARHVAGHVLSYQLPSGAWPKNINFFHDHCQRPLDINEGTIDNNATTTEVRFLMRLYQATQDTTYLHAALRGIGYLLHMQYANGGWPQYWPRRDHYHARITFNDNAMQNVMQLLREVYERREPFHVGVSDALRQQAREAFDRGVDCILKCQIRQQGRLTVWCQQHDEVTLQPVGARSFELPGLCQHESATIVLFLMSLPHPSEAVRQAVEGAVEWFRRSCIHEPDGSHRWARYYNLDDNRPFFCGRDGVKKYRLQDIDEERQRGYSWYGRQGDRVLERYKAWKQAQETSGQKDKSEAKRVQKYPIEDYDEPTVDAIAPNAEWEALADGLHCSWASRNELYQKHRVPELTESTTTTISAWRGERANLEAVLYGKTDQGTLSVRMAPLKRNGRGRGRKCASARFLNYVITDDGRGCGNHNFALKPWLVPDVIDLDKPKAVRARETRPVWCTIEVPRDMRPGSYTTRMEVLNEKGIVVKTLNLSVEVNGHTLPKPSEQKFHLDLWQQPYSVSRYYGVERWSKEHIKALRPYLQALGRAGQSVVTTILFYEPWGEQSHDKFSAMIHTTKRKDGTWQFDYDKFDKYVELCAECGIDKQINCYSMVTWDMKFRYFDEASGQDVDWALKVGSEDYNALWNAYLKDFRAHLEQKGWFDKTCIAMDERNEAQMLAAYSIIKANGFKMALAGNYHASLNDKLYDYCVSLSQGQRFTTAERAYRRDNGLVTTVYTCCTESEPNIFSNSLPAEAAFLPIHVAANGLDGYLHWSWINWDEHPLTDSRFRKFSAGDTYFYYPGNRSSVRFERLVEGIQQYEKIQILKKEKASDQAWMDALDALLTDYRSYAVAGSACADKVDKLETFLNKE